jgi:peptidase C39-like protein
MSKRFGAVAVLALVVGLMSVGPAAGKKGTAYQTGFDRWRAGDFVTAGWVATDGATVGAGGLALPTGAGINGQDPYAVGAYYGGNYYNAGSFKVGEVTSPRIATDFGFTEAIASWNADTPDGTWIETQISAEIAGRWTKWYSLGIWADDYATLHRHSVRLQGDTDGFVAVDTLILNGKKAPPADAYRLKFRLFSANGAVPTIRNGSLAYSTSAVEPTSLEPGSSANWLGALAVPECSQEVYPDGGEVWCSPTSTSMVLGFWGDPRTCENREHEVVDGVFDWIYDGHGNWPFNTAFAATKSFGGKQLEGYVVRFTSMAQLETWTAKGVPVVISYAWKKGDIDGVSVSSSDGHLAVVVGFDSNGDPIVNDPAEPAGNEAVQRVYPRSQLETQWLTTSGGTAYLMYPAGQDEGVLPS